MNVGCVPPDPEDMNNKRAEAAGRALLSFARDFGETTYTQEIGNFARQNLSDLFADIAHYCDREGVILLRCLSDARGKYEEETDGSGQQFSKLEINFFPY